MTTDILLQALAYFTPFLCILLLAVGGRLIYKKYAWKKEEKRRAQERAVKREAERRQRLYIEKI